MESLEVVLRKIEGLRTDLSAEIVEVEHIEPEITTNPGACSDAAYNRLCARAGGDPFAGSGSFLEACVTLGRECVVVEKGEAEYEAVVDRALELKKKIDAKKVVKSDM